MKEFGLWNPIYRGIARIIGSIFATILMLQSSGAISGLISDPAELDAILGDSRKVEDFESVELNFPYPPQTPDIWIGTVLDSEAGIIEGLVFTREPTGSLSVQDPLLLGGNQVLITNGGAIAIDFLVSTPAFGFHFDRPTDTPTEVTLNVFAEDDVTLLGTETIILYFDGFIGFSEPNGIGKATVGSFSVTLPYVTTSRIDDVVFGLSGVEIVEIDIKPRDDANIINLRSSGLLAVAILSTEDFDAPLEVDPMTVQFGPAGAAAAHHKTRLEDVDHDGDVDLLFKFRTQQTGIQCADTKATLIAETWDGAVISGTDSIQIVRCRQSR